MVVSVHIPRAHNFSVKTDRSVTVARRVTPQTGIPGDWYSAFAQFLFEPLFWHAAALADPADRIGGGRTDVDVSVIEVEIGGAVCQICSRATDQHRVVGMH